MIKKTIFTTVAAVLLATTAFALDDSKVKAIEVTADLAAVQNAEAATYWANLATDLQTAIALSVADKIADDGMLISVDVSEFDLETPFIGPIALTDTRLVGRVSIKAPPAADAAKTDLPASADADVVTLTVTFADAIPMLPAGVDATLLTRDSEDYYKAMVNGFAAGVAQRLN